MIQWNPTQHKTIQCHIIQNNRIQNNAKQYNARHNTTQYKTIQCKTIQYNAIQCNTRQFKQRTLYKINGQKISKIKHVASNKQMPDWEIIESRSRIILHTFRGLCIKQRGTICPTYVCISNANFGVIRPWIIDDMSRRSLQSIDVFIIFKGGDCDDDGVGGGGGDDSDDDDYDDE